MELPPERLRTG